MDISEKLTILGLPNKGQRQAKYKTQQRKLKENEQHGPLHKAEVNPGALEGTTLTLSASHMKSSINRLLKHHTLL